MEKKTLPDTPWHIGYTKKEKNDPRRHKGRCMHKEGPICKYGKSGCYMLRCMGSSHCIYYAENPEQYSKVLANTKTAEEEESDRIWDYRQQKIKAWEKLKSKGVEAIRARYTVPGKCPICFGALKSNKCKYCGFNLNGK